MFTLRLSQSDVDDTLNSLSTSGLIQKDRYGYFCKAFKDRQFESDDVSSRVKRYRKRYTNDTETPIVTPPDTDTETDTETETEIKGKKKKIKKKKADGKIGPYLDTSLLFHQYQQKEGLHHVAFKDELTEESSVVEDGADTLRLLIDRDGETMDEIKRVLTFVVKDDFWGKQVVSLNGLRKRGKNGNLKYFNAKNAMLSSGGDMAKTMKMISEWGEDE